jgi:hypothetical protein
MVFAIYCHSLLTRFGEGAEALLRILFSTMIREGAINSSSPDEVIALMRRNDESARRALLKMLKPYRVR